MKKFQGWIALLLVVALVFLMFRMCGRHGNNIVKVSRLDSFKAGKMVLSRIPDDVSFVYANLDIKEVFSLDDKTIDKLKDGDAFGDLFRDVEEEKDLYNIFISDKDTRKFLKKYGDDLDSVIGIIGMNRRFITDIMTGNYRGEKRLPKGGYIFIVLRFNKKINVEDLVDDIEDIYDLDGKAKASDKGYIEDYNGIKWYIERFGKDVVITYGLGYLSEIEEEDDNIMDNKYWKTLDGHFIAWYIGDDMLSMLSTLSSSFAGFSLPINTEEPFYGYLDMSLKGKKGNFEGKADVSFSNFLNLDKEDLEKLGISGKVKVVRDANLIMAADTDIISMLIDFIKFVPDLSSYEVSYITDIAKEYISSIEGGVMTISVAVKDKEEYIVALIADDIKDGEDLKDLVENVIGGEDDHLKIESSKHYFETVYVKDEDMKPSFTKERLPGETLIYFKVAVDQDTGINYEDFDEANGTAYLTYDDNMFHIYMELGAEMGK